MEREVNEETDSEDHVEFSFRFIIARRGPFFSEKRSGKRGGRRGE